MNSHHLTHPKYRPDIDGLRALAILSVVGFHAFPNRVSGGFIGVDIFFVISGYLISYIIFDSLAHNRFNFVEFYIRRIRRIFPALILVLLACFIFGWFALLPSEYKQLGKHIAGGAGFVSNYILWGESGYFDNASETKPLLHLWSLGVEEQFYIVWPLLLWFVWKQRLNMVTTVVLVGLISFVLNVSRINGDHIEAAFYSPQTRFWELLTGAMLAYSVLHNWRAFPRVVGWLDRLAGRVIYAVPPEEGQALRNLQSLIGASLIVIGLYLVTGETHFPGWWAMLPTLGAALLIAAGMRAWLNRVVLSSRILVWTGLISFPLYLWHWPLLSFARIVGNGEPTALARAGLVLLAFVLAWATYWLVEKPLRFGKHAGLKTVVLVLLMAVVGGVGYNAFLRDGLSFRYPKVLMELIQWDDRPLYRSELREGTCFLRPDQNYSAFSGCDVTAKAGVDKSLLLWGDSNAAHFYRGYESAFSGQYAIIQRTTSSCPPLLDMDFAPGCREINDQIFEYVKKKKPNKVVLSAMWVSYADDGRWRAVEKTIKKLREIGVNDIDLIGPVPQWDISLPTQLYKKFKADVLHRIPSRMTDGLKPKFIQLDHDMDDFARKINVRYFSPQRILCNDEGCITRFGDTFDSLTTRDSIHLTAMASRYVVSHFSQ